MRLADFQHRLQDAILAPVLASCDADLAIRTGPCRNACAHYRIAIHHSHFWTRMRDFAAYRYPLLARALGNAAFEELVRAFIAAHPPTAYTLGPIVEGLQQFVESPVLADLAAFDFCRSGLRITAEEATLSPEELAAIPRDVLARTRLRLKRRSALVTTRYRFEPGRITELPREPQQTHWLVYIADGKCVNRPVSLRMFAGLRLLAAGIAFADLFRELRALDYSIRECDAVLGTCFAADIVVAEDAR
jgi:Putative DNA-binding domain